MKTFADEGYAVRTVMRLLATEGVTKAEAAVARLVTDELVAAGVRRSCIVRDRANARFPVPTESGNVIVSLPGRGGLASATPRMFSAHMDTVALASGAKPVRAGGKVVPAGKTALGADDRAGVAALLSMVETLARLRVDHPPLVLVFTVCEEIGLWGSHHLDPAVVRRCSVGFNFDGNSPAEFAIAAPSQDGIAIEVDGIPAHAGTSPEKGASATVAFAEATVRLARGGWLGAVRKGSRRGTGNIGVVHGGLASNIVTSHISAAGEARSYSDAFLARIVGAFTREFETAARRTRNAAGASARATIVASRLYTTFDLGEDAPVVAEATRAARAVGLKPVCKRQFGGLDANWFNAHGLATVTLGAGGRNAHGTSEYLVLKDFLQACEMAVRLSGAALG